jgi:hypothetical protein
MHRSCRTAAVHASPKLKSVASHSERVGFSPPAHHMASCAEEEGGWAALPEELLLTVLDQLKWGRRESAAVRRMCSRWRRIHDAGRKRLFLWGDSTDEMVETLCARMPALTALMLYSKDLTDEGLQAVAKLESLTSLDLYECQLVTDEGLRAVAELKSLEHLNLAGCSLVTDEGLRAVAELKWLEHLDLGDCSKVTDVGLRHLSGLNQLTHLDLSCCLEVTDVGLRHLSGLNQLTILRLEYCKTSQSAEMELFRQLPCLDIEHDHSRSDDDSDEDDWNEYDDEHDWN